MHQRVEIAGLLLSLLLHASAGATEPILLNLDNFTPRAVARISEDEYLLGGHAGTLPVAMNIAVDDDGRLTISTTVYDTLGGALGVIRGMTGDGAFVVGSATTERVRMEATLWTSPTTPMGLGYYEPADYWSRANDVVVHDGRLLIPGTSEGVGLVYTFDLNSLIPGFAELPNGLEAIDIAPSGAPVVGMCKINSEIKPCYWTGDPAGPRYDAPTMLAGKAALSPDAPCLAVEGGAGYVSPDGRWVGGNFALPDEPDVFHAAIWVKDENLCGDELPGALAPVYLFNEAPAGFAASAVVGMVNGIAAVTDWTGGLTGYLFFEEFEGQKGFLISLVDFFQLPSVGLDPAAAGIQSVQYTTDMIQTPGGSLLMVGSAAEVVGTTKFFAMIPGLCEPASIEDDCNGNERSDACEVRQGEVPDCNGDGVPDVCQGILGPCGCPADFDRDGAVNAEDLADLLGHWGACPGCPQDLTGDDLVNSSDVETLIGQWGVCQAP